MDKGYIQLIDINTKQVLAQREGLNTPEFFEYHRHKVWVVKPEQALIFVDTSECSHPPKFFRALPDNTYIKVYKELTTEEPEHLTPDWEGTIEALEREHYDMVTEFGTWNAFDQDHNWVGTSEY
ncbi:hypothetical protein F0223_23815 [Vibrio coralliilyticus]|uniref:hypothetical protein n=1 Tax=Vibrio TaxID=662 RepID=UPI00068BCE6B|nr:MULTISPECIES: hypothetical protein [Vibrio]NOI21228.1 hypothetical protein [Vibrio coralliilyticus]